MARMLAVLNSFRQRFRNWAFRRTVETGTVILNQRRIYILPTRRSVGFACVLILMLLGDINYNLNLGYAFTFLLATSGGLSMLYTFRNMAGLKIHAGSVAPVFAGENVGFVFHFDNPGSLQRYQLHLHDDAGHLNVFDLPPRQVTAITLPLPSVHRGWQDSGRLTLHTEFPLGLFHAWTYLHFDVCGLVYPKPSAPYPLPTTSGLSNGGRLSSSGDDDFAGLRDYAPGDALPRIAWKTLARAQGLQVKQFTAEQGSELWLDESLLDQTSVEHKLEILTRWLLDADTQGLHYGLRLTGKDIAPQHGVAHRAECLRALALFGLNEK